MEIFSNLDSAASKEFEKLLSTQFSKDKNRRRQRSILQLITKISDKYIWAHIEGLKSEPLDRY